MDKPDAKAQRQSVSVSDAHTLLVTGFAFVPEDQLSDEYVKSWDFRAVSKVGAAVLDSKPFPGALSFPKHSEKLVAGITILSVWD